MIRYMFIIEQGETSWGAHVPDIPGCIAVGETRDEVIQLMQEAIALHIDDLRSQGLPIPRAITQSAFADIEAA